MFVNLRVRGVFLGRAHRVHDVAASNLYTGRVGPSIAFNVDRLQGVAIKEGDRLFAPLPYPAIVVKDVSEEGVNGPTSVEHSPVVGIRSVSAVHFPNAGNAHKSKDLMCLQVHLATYACLGHLAVNVGRR